MIDTLVFLYNSFLYQPLFNALILLYNLIPGQDFGIAIIVLTFILRLILYPLSAKAFLAQKLSTEIQPKLSELREKFKHDKDALLRKTLELYQKHGISPVGSLGPLLLQFPILIALFQVFSRGFQDSQLSILYPFVQNPGVIDPLFLGAIHVSEKSLVLAAIAGILQILQTQIGISSRSGSSDKGQAMIQKYIMPIFLSAFTFGILTRLPAAVGIYWVATTIFSILQQWYLGRRSKASTL